MTISECACATSKIITSAPALIKAADLSIVSFTPTAAPTLNLPLISLFAFGQI